MMNVKVRFGDVYAVTGAPKDVFQAVGLIKHYALRSQLTNNPVVVADEEYRLKPYSSPKLPEKLSVYIYTNREAVGFHKAYRWMGEFLLKVKAHIANYQEFIARIFTPEGPKLETAEDQATMREFQRKYPNYPNSWMNYSAQLAPFMPIPFVAASTVIKAVPKGQLDLETGKVVPKG